jgi:cell shape-determining protein MreC
VLKAVVKVEMIILVFLFLRKVFFLFISEKLTTLFISEKVTKSYVNLCENVNTDIKKFCDTKNIFTETLPVTICKKKENFSQK